MSYIDDEIESFLRDALRVRLTKCTERQRLRFHKYYPAPIKAAKLREAIALCDRTIAHNAAASEEARNMIASVADLRPPEGDTK